MKHLVILTYGGKSATFVGTLHEVAILLRVMREAGATPSIKGTPIWE